jgi:hypothetical protein
MDPRSVIGLEHARVPDSMKSPHACGHVAVPVIEKRLDVPMERDFDVHVPEVDGADAIALSQPADGGRRILARFGQDGYLGRHCSQERRQAR